MRISSGFKLPTKRLFLSAAVKKMFVRLVSTLMTSSESCGTSSFERGVGDGDGAALALVSFFANWLRLAKPPQRRRKTSTNKTTTRYCISYFQSPLLHDAVGERPLATGFLGGDR